MASNAVHLSSPQPGPEPGPPRPRLRLSRAFAIVAGCALLAAVAITIAVASGLVRPELLSLKSVGLNYHWLRSIVEGDLTRSAALYVGGYTLLGALALPGSAILVIVGGLLFGTMLGLPLAIAGSMLAATAGYLSARTLLGGLVGRFQHPAIDRFRAGFTRNALSYLLFLRLSPGLPFAVLNVVPSLIGVPLSTFLLATFVGTLPSRIALSTAGAGLGHAIGAENTRYTNCLATSGTDGADCTYDLTVASLLTPETVVAFVGLALLALLPALADSLTRARKPGAGPPGSNPC